MIQKTFFGEDINIIVKWKDTQDYKEGQKERKKQFWEFGKVEDIK